MPRLALSEGGAAQLCVGRLYSFMSRFMYVNALSILPIGGLLEPRTSHRWSRHCLVYACIPVCPRLLTDCCTRYKVSTVLIYCITDPVFS